MDASAWDQRYAGTDLVWSATPNQFVAAELADLPPGRAADLAAGEGRNALWLATRGWRVTAVDFSAVGLDKGRAVEATLDLAHPVDWVCADVLAWAPPAAYDLVVIAYLQVVAAERRAAVRRAVEALRPGGTFLLVAHDTSNLTEGVGGPQDASVLMTADDVLADLDGIEVDVVRAGRVTREVPGEGGPATAYDALVRVVRRG
jgi:SAM-dependent methyltransferase